MSDINPVMAAKTVFVGICLANGVEPKKAERAWIDEQISEIPKKRLEKWPIEKLRKHLLESFCEPTYVEEALMKIQAVRL
jgi:hypothetical protein